MEQAPGLVPGELCFVHLCGYTLKAFLNACPALLQAKPERKVVIVASPRMMPVARHWTRGVCRVHALFSTDVPVSVVIAALAAGNSTPASSRPLVSARDISILRYHLNSGRADGLSALYGRSPKTLYGRKALLARRLGVPRLEFLFFAD